MEYGMLEELKELTEARHGKVSDIVAEALQIGISKLWQERVLSMYLQGEIDRKEAIKRVGLNVVKLAERQKKASLDDVKWGLYG
jgi:tRNA A37 N6-isopentenylltransferase MiaA